MYVGVQYIFVEWGNNHRYTKINTGVIMSSYLKHSSSYYVDLLSASCHNPSAGNRHCQKSNSGLETRSSLLPHLRVRDRSRLRLNTETLKLLLTVSESVTKARDPIVFLSNCLANAWHWESWPLTYELRFIFKTSCNFRFKGIPD